MKNVVRLELGKAFKNWRFLLSILIGCALNIGSAVIRIQSYYSDSSYFQKIASAGIISNPVVEAESFYNRWIGADAYTLFATLFFYLAPLLCTIPFAWSYCQERNRYYERNMVVRCGRYRYYSAKWIATFCAGGLAVLIPVLLNILVVSMFVPARTPSIDYVIYSYGIYYPELGSKLLYTMPALYVCMRLLIIFVFCGLLAVLGMSIAYITKNQVAVLITSFFICVALQFIEGGVFAFSKYSASLSPINFLGQIGNTSKFLWGVLLEGGIIAAITIISTCVRGKRHEIY
jgi:hypothetical protein